MTPRQAAEVIGCSVRYVRTLIHAKKLKAQLKLQDMGQGGPYTQVWDIHPREAGRFKRTIQTKGWPRGKKRGTS